jgi:ankyrin repeat protein
MRGHQVPKEGLVRHRRLFFTVAVASVLLSGSSPDRALFGSSHAWLYRTDVSAAPQEAAGATGPVDFVRDVQPILRQNCYGCHGPTQQMNNLRLDRRRDAMRGGTIAVIGPGASETSRLYLRLSGSQCGPQMPPTGPLKAPQVAMIKAWIDQGAIWPDEASGEAPLPAPDPRATRLIDALRAGDARAVATLVSADPKAASLRGPGGTTPLMSAVLYGDAAAVQLLLDAEVDPNVRNDAGATALMWAVTDLTKTRLLLEHGAEVNVKSDDRRTPLMIASGIPGTAPVVALLLEHGADMSAKAPGLIGDTTPLTEAIYTGDEPVFRLLLDRGADVNASGPVTLALALGTGCTPCVDALLKKTNPAFVTPALAISSPPFGPALFGSLLLDHGADLNAKDDEGRTMLMLVAASQAMPLKSIEALIARGADVNATSAHGETAASLAQRHGHTAVVDLLTKAGAKIGPAPTAPATRPAPAVSLRAAVDRSLPLLQRSDATFLRKSGCVSCHNDTLTAMTVATSRQMGLLVNEDVAREERTTIGAYIEAWRERALQGNGIPGDSDTVSYILLGLGAEKFPADGATDAMAWFVKRQQTADGHWRILAHRPPIESNDIEVTAASMRAMQLYAPATRRAEFDEAIKRAAAWLAAATPKVTEERAFQLLGLAWSNAGHPPIEHAAHALAAEQRRDGGWAQLPSLESDAYATGQALVALTESGAVAASDPIYKRGVQFLLNTQFADGSWFVRTRALPIQPHFESGFPFGHDQFISAAATNWATRALALAYVKPS